MTVPLSSSRMVLIAVTLFGVLIFLNLMLTPFFLIDRQMRVMDAVRASMNFMDGNRLIALGVWLLFAGLFVAIPFMLLTNAKAREWFAPEEGPRRKP